MTIFFTIPFWVLPLILAVIGLVGFELIIRKSGSYDILTPMFAVIFAIFFIMLAIGLALGGWLF